MSKNTAAAPLDPSSISSSLLRRVQQQDGAAWRKLVQLYGTLVYRWCRQAGFQPSDAADVVQDVFLSVLMRVGEFRRQRPGDSFRGWIWTITRSRLVDHYRQRFVGVGGSEAQRWVEQLPATEDAASEVRIPGERSRLMRRILELIRDDFEPRTWQAFWRTTVDGQPAPDVAAELGMSPVAVRQAKFRVLTRLREEIEALL